MNLSFRLGTIRGVRVEIHALFALTLLYGAIEGWWRLGSWFGAAYGLLTINLLFASVLVHEIAHMHSALRHGIIVRRISILPLGGMAELNTLPDDPRVELEVALAGPLANLGLAAIFTGLLMTTMQIWPFSLTPYELLSTATSPTPAGLLLYLALINLGLALLNLLPVFPLDGGRVLRSLLALAIPNRVATRATIWLGGFAALGMVWWGMFNLSSSTVLSSISVLMMAAILMFGSSHESVQDYLRQRLERLHVHDAISGGTTWTVSPSDSLASLASSHVFKTQPVIPVVNGVRLLGVLTVEDLADALTHSGMTHVAHAMRTQFPRVQMQDTLWHARQSLLQANMNMLPVLEGQVLRGLITYSDIEQTAHRDPGSQGSSQSIIPYK